MTLPAFRSVWMEGCASWQSGSVIFFKPVPVQGVKKRRYMVISGGLKDKTSCTVLDSLELFSEILWESDKKWIAVVQPWKDERADEDLGYIYGQVMKSGTNSAVLKRLFCRCIYEIDYFADIWDVLFKGHSFFLFGEDDTKIPYRWRDVDGCIVNKHRSQEYGWYRCNFFWGW